MKKQNKISLLDWLIFLSVIILFITIYIPQKIWAEEDYYKNESRHRMKVIADAAEFYKELTGHYSSDGNKVFSLVEAATDSLIADSLFIGEQYIIINNKKIKIEIEKGFEVRADTTFSKAEKIRRTIVDTIYTIGMNNVEQLTIDTLFVNVKNLNQYKSDPTFKKIIKEDIITRSEIVIDYLRNKFHLTNELLLCPLTNEKYQIMIDSTDVEDIIFQVQSPVPIDFKESRYFIFAFYAGNHGSIQNGISTWASN